MQPDHREAEALESRPPLLGPEVGVPNRSAARRCEQQRLRLTGGSLERLVEPLCERWGEGYGPLRVGLGWAEDELTPDLGERFRDQ